MMNRGKLEDWAVRLYMLYKRNRIHKSAKSSRLKEVRVKVTKLREPVLIEWIESYLTALEAM